ncbi:hypothetical protein BP5796_12871 [Coleophoma crateriformis]|uniref:Uncharacterized protein n=1 Tax=Coleophoma crateriformis TaxID=565419 RepID=A0A3D8Q5W4_9HELO|nr:hypothetical protein BP5796_12871 [Coleophoma crateriformis]
MEEERKDKKVLRGAAGSLCEGQVERAEDELENDFTGWISPFQAFSTFNLQASPSSSNPPFFITLSRSVFTPLQASESSKASSDSSPDAQESMASSSTDPADAGNKLQLVIASASALAATNTTLQLDDNDFTSIDGVIEYTKSVPAENRYACQQQIMEGLMEHQQAFTDNVERFYEYMKSSKDYELNKITPAEFTQQWAATEALVTSNKRKRNDTISARNTILNTWSTAQNKKRLEAWLHDPRRSNQLIQNLRSTIAITNRLIIKRKTGNASGVPRKLGVISSDLTNISKKNDPARDETPLTEQEMEQYKLRYNILGFVELDDGTPLLEFSPEASPVQVVIPVKGKGKEPVVQPSEEKTLGRILRSRKAKSQSQYGNEYNPLPTDLDVIDEDELQRLEDEDLEEALQEDEGDDYEEVEPGTKRKRGTGDTAEKGGCGCSTDVPYAWKEAKFARTVSDDTFQWFRLANRPTKASDKLGAYRFFHEEPKPYIVTDDDAYDILEYLSTSKVLATNVSLDNDTGTLTKWEEVRSVNINLFAWLFKKDPKEKKSLFNIMEAELDMYHHHLRKINGKANLGWARNCYYSIVQQVIRQDPVYWLMYVALRPDHHWRLISYPYYGKYAMLGDSTFFSVSLDTEDDEMAIVLLPGMHNKLAEWWNRCQARGIKNESFVIRIDEKMWTKKDKEHFGIDWTPVPCQPGDARITTPALPHGASGPAKKLRRTVLPWYVGIQDDHHHLEIPESGTWDEISACHRDLLPPPASPSGLPNRYGTVPYPFPAALELMDLSAISDALVGRRRWNSPAVQAEMMMLLKGSYTEREKFFRAYRTKVKKAVKDNMKTIVDMERKAFGKKSYWNLLDQYGTADKIPIIVDDIEPIDATSDDPILSMHYNEDPDKNDSALKPITKDEDNDDDNDDNDDDEINVGRMEIEEMEEDLYGAD